jgi:Fe-S cluster biogenesis protein NfuA
MRVDGREVTDGHVMTVDREMLDSTLEALTCLIAAHAGGIELVNVDTDGVVTLRFTGMCTGCELRPITTLATVRPALMAVNGVTGVRVTGVRLSEEAEQRFVETLRVDRQEDRVARMVQHRNRTFS